MLPKQGWRPRKIAFQYHWKKYFCTLVCTRKYCFQSTFPNKLQIVTWIQHVYLLVSQFYIYFIVWDLDNEICTKLKLCLIFKAHRSSLWNITATRKKHVNLTLNHKNKILMPIVRLTIVIFTEYLVYKEVLYHQRVL